MKQLFISAGNTAHSSSHSFAHAHSGGGSIHNHLGKSIEFVWIYSNNNNNNRWIVYFHFDFCMR